MKITLFFKLDFLSRNHICHFNVSMCISFILFLENSFRQLLLRRVHTRSQSGNPAKELFNKVNFIVAKTFINHKYYNLLLFKNNFNAQMTVNHNIYLFYL